MTGVQTCALPIYFRKESTLAAHLCEQKRRYQQERETGVQFGFRAYLQFYETTQGSARFKTYDDFVGSPYYKAFVKFGRYCVDVKAINPARLTEWLLKNNKKIKDFSISGTIADDSFIVGHRERIEKLLDVQMRDFGYVPHLDLEARLVPISLRF